MTFAEFIGASTWGVLLAGTVGYLSRMFLEHRLGKDLEGYKTELLRAIENQKSALAIVANSLDCLHQERVKATIELIKLLKAAMGTMKTLVSPMTNGIDHVTLGNTCWEACTAFHNRFVEVGFLFPDDVATKFHGVRDAMLNDVMDEVNIHLNASVEKSVAVYSIVEWKNLRNKIKEDVDPLVEDLIAFARDDRCHPRTTNRQSRSRVA